MNDFEFFLGGRVPYDKYEKIMNFAHLQENIHM